MSLSLLFLFPYVAIGQMPVATFFFNPHELIVHESNAAKAFVQNKQVLVKWKQKPAYIYYGWQPFSIRNLQNSEQLPASTFKLKVE